MLLSRQFNESTISINGCFDMGSEALVCSNQMLVINFEYNAGYGVLESIMGVLTTSLTVLWNDYILYMTCVDYIPYSLVEWGLMRWEVMCIGEQDHWDWNASPLGVSQPYHMVQSLIERCAVFCCVLGPSRASKLSPEHVQTATLTLKPYERKVRRHDVSLVIRDSQNHRSCWEFRMHDCWDFIRVSA